MCSSDLVMFASMEYQLRKIHGVQGKDGIEKILTGMITAIGFVTACVPFINFELVQLRVHVFGLMRTPYGLGAVGFAVGGASHIAVNWLLVFIFVQGAFVYVIGTLKWLNLLRWEPDMETGKKDKMIFAYRMHQAMHIVATESSSTILAFAIAADAVLMISLLVALIGFQDKLGVMLSFAFMATFLVSVTATKMLLDLSTYLTGCSANFANSFLSNDFTLSQAQRRAMKICPPLEFKIGSFSTASNETFPFLMSDIVASQVADILVGLNETALNV